MGNARRRRRRAGPLILLLAALSFLQLQCAAGGALQDLFDQVVLNLGDVSVEKFSTKATIKNIVCADISLSDVHLSPVSGANASTHRGVRAKIEGLHVACAAKASATGLFTIAETDATASVQVKLLQTDVMFVSEDFELHAPTRPDLLVDSCKVEASVTLHFPSSALDNFAPGLESMISSYLLTSDQLCGLLRSVATQPFTASLSAAQGWIAKHQALAHTEVDRLAAAQQLTVRPAWLDFEADEMVRMAFDTFNSAAKLALPEAAAELGAARALNFTYDSTAASLVRAVTQGTGNFTVAGNNVTLLNLRSSGFDLELLLSSLQLTRLDSVAAFSPLRVYGPQTLETNITLAELGLEADLVLSLRASVGSGADVRISREVFHLSAGLADTEINLAVALGLNSLTAQALPFGGALSDPFHCLLTTFDALRGARTMGSARAIPETPRVFGLLDAQMTQVMQDAVAVLMHVYGPSALLAVPGLIMAEAPRIVTAGFADLIRGSKCPAPWPYDAEHEFFDFGAESLWKDLMDMVRRDVLPALNEGYIAPFTRDQSGRSGKFVIQEDRGMWGLKINPMGELTLTAAQISAAGLDSISEVELMGTPRPFVLRNAFRLGGPLENAQLALLPEAEAQLLVNSSSPRLAAATGARAAAQMPPVVMSFVLEANFAGPAKSFANKFDFSLTLEGLRVQADVLAKINRTAFDLLPLGQLVDPQCLLSRLNAAAFEALSLSFERVRVGLRCLACSSPGMSEMERLVAEQDRSDQFTETVNEWIATVLERFREKLDPAELQRTIEVARAKCAGEFYVESHVRFVPHAESTLSVFGVVGGVAALILLSLVVGCCLRAGRARCCGKRCSVWCRSAPCPGSGRGLGKSRADSAESAGSTSSMQAWARRFHRFDSSLHDDAADIVLDQSHALALEQGGVAEEEAETAVAAAATFGAPAERVGASGGVQRMELAASPDTRRARRRAANWTALAFHRVTPVYMRYGVVAVLLANIFLFIVGHLVVAANVNVLFTLLGDDLLLGNAAGFSIGKSIKDLWEAGIIPLALLIAGLSGAFPYLKILVMLYCWCAPQRLLGPARRGKILDTFDMVGKWSMIDVYVLMLIMVAFGLEVDNPRLDILPPGFYAVRVFVDPAVGLVSFTFAAMLALLVNNLLVLAHRNAAEADAQARLEEEKARAGVVDEDDSLSARLSALGSAAEADELGAIDSMAAARGGGRRPSSWLEGRIRVSGAEALSAHVFTMSDGRRVQFSAGGRRAVLALLVASTLLLGVGCLVPSYGYRILGVIGMFLDIDEVRSWQPYSIFDTFAFAARQSVESPSASPDYVLGLLFLAACFILTAFAMPLMQLLGLTALWWRPMTLRGQKRAYLLAEVAAAWSCVDVFVVALVVAVLEMGQISSMLLRPVCRNVMPLIDDILVPTGFVQESNATCLFIGASLEVGCALLLAGALLTNALTQLVLRASHKAMHEREEDSHDALLQRLKPRRTPVRLGRFLRLMLWCGRKTRAIRVEPPDADKFVLGAGAAVGGELAVLAAYAGAQHSLGLH